MTAQSPISAERQAEKKPLRTRRRLLTFFAVWCMIGLMAACNIGLCIGRALWHAPFSFSDPKNWTPFFLLIASFFSALTQFQLILGGSYQGGEVDRNRRAS